VDPNGRSNLISKAEEVIRSLEGIPASARYRKDTEALMRSWIQTAQDQRLTDEQVEATLGRGQLEELIIMCREELNLIPGLKGA
jgi:hypothetical protein